VTADYFAPAFQVEVEGTRLAADVTKNITSVEVRSEPSAIDHLALTLANAFPSLRWTHTEDAELFAEGASVRVQVGYVGRMQPVFDGEVTMVSPSFPESGHPTVRVEALSRLHWLDRGTKLRPFRDVTDSQIVAQVAEEAGLTPQAESTTTKHPYMLQNNQTDLVFLLERAKHLRFELLVRGRDLVFRTAQERAAKRYTLVWGNPQEGASGSDTLPLRSFSPSLNARRPVAAVVVRGHDPVTGDAIEERASSGDEDARMGKESGADVAAGAFRAEQVVVLSDLPVASKAEAKDRARSEFNRRARQLVTGRGTSIGVPDLRSGDVVELRGIGRFSGPYYITTIAHRIGADGYRTDFGVERSGIG
jgi:uncharacterized protein